MNPEQQINWKDAVLGEILQAVSAHESLRDALVFKGARILNLHLATQRQSMDIDANLQVEFQRSMPDRLKQAEWFEKQLATAIRNHFENQSTVRYVLESVKVVPKPPEVPHPQGWDGLEAKVRVSDQRLRGERSLPTVELDMAAPEMLGPDAVCNLRVAGVNVRAYALHRIAGEKLRAFLTSLPAYRDKIHSPRREARAKDLHDIARILAVRPISDTAFWQQVADEFRLACESRFVDCAGPETFRQAWPATQATYESEATLSAVSWRDAEHALAETLDQFSKFEIFPLSFRLPSPSPAPSS